MPFSAQAQLVATEVVKAINETTDQQIQEVQQGTKETKEALERAISGEGGLLPGLIQYENERRAEETYSAPIYEISEANNAMPEAISLTDSAARFVMEVRMNELQRIKYDAKDRKDYLVDTSDTPSINMSQFDIFMRYFCDPKSRAGKMANYYYPRRDVVYSAGTSFTTYSYKLRCGYVEDGNAGSLPTRRSLLGSAADTGQEASQIIGLPTRPADLFFNPITFPTAGVTSGTNVATNTNRMAGPAYLAAFAQALQFLVGSAPTTGGDVGGDGDLSGDPGKYIAAQRGVAVSMLASYPFALLFAERTGTMGPEAARSVAYLLQTKLSVATQNPTILAQIKNLESRNSLSMAEYLNVVAYQLPTSPGYFERINDLTPSQLKREVVWLTAIQTALNYQRNRWLEILAALEAVS